MKKVFISIAILCAGIVSIAQVARTHGGKSEYAPLFEEVYLTEAGQNIPKGILEAIAWTNTRFQNLVPTEQQESCMGMPKRWGIMGFISDDKGVFNRTYNHIRLIYSKNDGLRKFYKEDLINYLDGISADPKWDITLYTKALSNSIDSSKIYSKPEDYAVVLAALSEYSIDEDSDNTFALDSYLYSIYWFLDNPIYQRMYNFPAYDIDFEKLFGADNYAVLSSSHVTIQGNTITNKSGVQYRNRSTDYVPAIWNAAASCNYSSRNGVSVSAVTIHTIQGSYSSAINWFQNCAASVSAHYILRSFDGQVTQMVAESDKAWHVGSENPYTIGLEHEGFVSDPSWYTAAMYQSSADLVKDICNSGYGINPLSTYTGSNQGVLNSCYRIKGHSHFPNQTHTDPGVNWNWQRYYNLINDTISTVVRETACTGIFTDNGGSGGNYGDFETYLTIIEPTGATEVTMTFTSFATEQDYDSLYVFDGDNENAPLLGAYTGNAAPGTLTATSGKMALLFTSDCIINDLGWQATWTCQSCPGSLAILTDSIKAVTCNSGNNGYIQVSATGGGGSYQYEWNTGATVNNINNLQPGIYQVTVSDASGCIVSTSITVPNTAAMSVSLQASSLSCNGDQNASITSTVSGGNPSYGYSWSSGASTSGLTNLGAGTYTLTVTDNDGCEDVKSVTISEPVALSGQLGVIDVFCNGESTGSIGPAISGGVLPYSYSWSTGTNSSSLQNVSAGNYSFTVSDANGCSLSLSATVNEPAAALSVSLTPTVVACGASDGSITTIATGGTTPYNYLWSNGGTTSGIQNLSAGAYQLTITDANGCTAMNSVTVTNTAAMSVSLSASSLDCAGDQDATITSSVSGGAAPYIYNWSAGATTNNLINLGAGTYTLTVTDNNGCQDVKSTIIVEPNPIDILLTPTSVSCFGTTDGTISSAVSGGTFPYTYSWSNNTSSPSINGITTGAYRLTVTDANGCIGTESATVNEPTELVDELIVSAVSCYDNNDGIALINVSGGMPPYTYQWNDNSTINYRLDLSSGNYDYTVTDQNNCTQTGSATISAPGPINVASVEAICDPAFPSVAWGSISGGIPPYIKTWQASNFPFNPSDSCDLITLHVEDANGCSWDSTVYFQPITTSVNSPAQSNLNWSIYPNPAKDQLTISLVTNQPEQVTIRLFATDGKLLWNNLTVVQNDLNIQVSLHQYPKGIYYLLMETSTENRVEKVVIQ